MKRQKSLLIINKGAHINRCRWVTLNILNQQEVGIVEKGDLKCTFRGVFETSIIMHKKWKKLWNWKTLSSNHSLKYLKLIPGYLCSTLIASQPVIPDTHSCTVQIGHVVHQAQEPNISLYWFHTLLWDGTAVTDYECLSLYFYSMDEWNHKESNFFSPNIRIIIALVRLKQDSRTVDELCPLRSRSRCCGDTIGSSAELEQWRGVTRPLADPASFSGH